MLTAFLCSVALLASLCGLSEELDTITLFHLGLEQCQPMQIPAQDIPQLADVPFEHREELDQ